MWIAGTHAKLTVALGNFANALETRFLRKRLELDFMMEKKTGKANPHETEKFYRKFEFNVTMPCILLYSIY
jgi:hypothetical protein